MRSRDQVACATCHRMMSVGRCHRRRKKKVPSSSSAAATKKCRHPAAVAVGDGQWDLGSSA
jgi:hypothetical protein